MMDQNIKKKYLKWCYSNYDIFFVIERTWLEFWIIYEYDTVSINHKYYTVCNYHEYDTVCNNHEYDTVCDNHEYDIFHCIIAVVE